MEIPIYPARRPLALGDRDSLQEVFRQLQPQVSELSFANLYLFRSAHRYELSSLEGSLVIFGCGYRGEPYFLPPVNGDAGGSARLLLTEGGTLYGADEQFVASHLQGEAFSVSEDRDNCDYLYLREELATLPGNRFHKKKNRINYFISRHNPVVEVYGAAHLAGARQLLQEWQRVHEAVPGSTLHHELEATREGLDLAGTLGLEGVVVLLEGVVVAFALGEQLNRDTAVCHFEKTNPFMEGLGQLINREFSRSLPDSCSYINREQDLGEAGLRSAKMSYHPVSLVKKFRVTRK